MPKLPKPEPDELHAVDPYFRDPGLPELTVVEKHKLLMWLDALIARHEFYCDEIREAIDAGNFAPNLHGQHNEFVRRMSVLKWMHKIVSQAHPTEHRRMAEAEGPPTD